MRKWKESERERERGEKHLAAPRDYFSPLFFCSRSLFSSFVLFTHSFILPSLFRVIQWLYHEQKKRVSWRGHKTYNGVTRRAFIVQVMEEQMPSHVHWSLLLQFKGNILIYKPRRRKWELNSQCKVLSLSLSFRIGKFPILLYFSFSHFPSRFLASLVSDLKWRGELNSFEMQLDLNLDQ